MNFGGDIFQPIMYIKKTYSINAELESLEWIQWMNYIKETFHVEKKKKNAVSRDFVSAYSGRTCRKRIQRSEKISSKVSEVRVR